MKLFPHLEQKQQLWTAAFVMLGASLLGMLVLWPTARIEFPEPQLKQILARGALRVATVNNPATYFNLHDQGAGFEHDLALALAKRLGVELEMVSLTSFSELFDAVQDGRADLAAASITATERRRQWVRFGPSYDSVSQEVIYRAGSRRPRSLADLVGTNLAVIAESSYAETLNKLSDQHQNLSWREIRGTDIETLFQAIDDRELDVTLADSHIFAIHRRFYPNLKRAFSISEPQPLAWAFPANNDRSLMAVVEDFFAQLEKSGKLRELRDRYQAHLPYFDKINAHYYLRHIVTRLPRLRPVFEEAASDMDLDWRLLAAIGYQESHWDNDAISPTGVRGVMMLTSITAEMMGVADRRDAAQSILGGTRYLARMKARLPKRIAEPDRTWMALAAYNVGFGHLEDARILTESSGGNPDKWSEVAQRLPLLSNPEWYRKTRHGYARGREPVLYVRNIRSYYDILVWRLNRTAADNAFIGVAP